MDTFGIELTPAQWDAVLNAIVVVVLGVLARFGVKVARESTTQVGDKVAGATTQAATAIVERLNTIDGHLQTIEDRLDQQESRIDHLSETANGVAQTVDQVAATTAETASIVTPNLP